MNETLDSGLVPGARSGLYRLTGRTGAKAVRAAAEAAGWQFLHLDAGTLDHKAQFLAAAAETLQFPQWAGHNWDAFEELLNNLSWLPPAPGYILLLDRVGRFGRRQPRELEIALDVLKSVMVNRQAAGDTPMIVLVRGGGPAADDLPTMETGPLPDGRVTKVTTDR